MKKALVFVLILGFLGTLAFAQSPSLTWNGYAGFGGLVTSSGGTTNFLGWDSNAWDSGRFQLEGKYSAKEYGMAFRLRDSNFSDSHQAWNIKRAYGWVDLFNGMVKLNGGLLGDYTWSTGQFSSFGNFDGQAGLQVQVMPVKGVNVGVFVPTWLNKQDSNALTDAFKGMSIGGSYSSDMISAGAGYTISSNNLWLGVTYSGMKNLTAYLESNSTVGGGTTNFYLDEYVAYDLGTMSVGSYLDEYYETGLFQFHASPQFTYNLSKTATLGLVANFAMSGSDMGYGAGAYANLTVGDSGWVQLGGDYNGGTVAPASAAIGIQEPVYDPLYFGKFPTQANASLVRAFVDFGMSF